MPPLMELTELLATACTVVLLPLERNAEPLFEPTVIPKVTLVAVADIAAELD